MTEEEKIKLAKNEYLKKWRRNNKEKVNEYNRKWRSENKDKVKEHQDRHFLKKYEEQEGGVE